MLPPELMPERILQDQIDKLVNEIARNPIIHQMARDYVVVNPKKFNPDVCLGLNLLQSDDELPFGMVTWLRKMLESYPFSLAIQNDPVKKVEKLRYIPFTLRVLNTIGVQRTERMTYGWIEFRTAFTFLQEITKEILFHCHPEPPCLIPRAPPGGPMLPM